VNVAKLYAQFVGIVLTLVGIVSFIPLLQTSVFTASGAPSGSYLLLGIFALNPLHNVIHILTGVLALGAWFYGGGRYLRWYALVFGVVYVLVTILGIVMGTNILGLIPINPADDGLHALLALGGLAGYFLTNQPQLRTA
jgi:hypothetical protein